MGIKIMVGARTGTPVISYPKRKDQGNSDARPIGWALSSGSPLEEEDKALPVVLYMEKS